MQEAVLCQLPTRQWQFCPAWEAIALRGRTPAGQASKGICAVHTLPKTEVLLYQGNLKSCRRVCDLPQRARTMPGGGKELCMCGVVCVCVWGRLSQRPQVGLPQLAEERGGRVGSNPRDHLLGCYRSPWRGGVLL